MELPDVADMRGFVNRVIRFAFNPARPDEMFAAIEVRGVIRSTDGGESWTDRGADLIALSEQPHLKSAAITTNTAEGMLDVHAVTVSSAEPEVPIIACRMGLFRSEDHGTHWNDLSRDSRLGQRIDHSLPVKVMDSLMDRVVERGDVGESLMGEVMRFEIVPDDLDIVEFRRVFGQPFDGEPVCPGGEGRAGKLADMDRSIVLDQHDWLDLPARHGAVELVELREMRHEIGAAFGWAGVDDELARHVIERAQHGHFFGLPGGWHAQIGA
jgi:hypothetical protein